MTPTIITQPVPTATYRVSCSVRAHILRALKFRTDHGISYSLSVVLMKGPRTVAVVFSTSEIITPASDKSPYILVGSTNAAPTELQVLIIDHCDLNCSNYTYGAQLETLDQLPRLLLQR